MMQSHKNDHFLALGKAIRAERQRLSLTQTELAEFAGCGLTFVNQLERGKPSVRLEKLFTVLEVLGLSLTLTKGKELLVVKKP
jgi:HTH-type transcriptional regulator/antitoxin HipB